MPTFWDCYPAYEERADGSWVGTLRPLPTLRDTRAERFDPIVAEGPTRDDVRRALNLEMLTRLYAFGTAEEQRDFLEAFAVPSRAPKPVAEVPPPRAVR